MESALKCIPTLKMVATPAIIIATSSAPWAEHNAGYVTLWLSCLKTNFSNHTCVGAEYFCRKTAMAGPAWLEICRTMMSVTIPVYLCAIYCRLFGVRFTRPRTLLEHLQARMCVMTYIFIAILMLTSATLYAARFQDYYTEIEDRRGVRLGASPIFAFVGGGILLALSIFFSIIYDTGFIPYVKNNFKCCRHCLACITAAFTFMCKKKNGVNNNNNNNNNDNHHQTQNTGNGSRSALSLRVGGDPNHQTGDIETCPQTPPPAYSVSSSIASDRFIFVEIQPTSRDNLNSSNNSNNNNNSRSSGVTSSQPSGDRQRTAARQRTVGQTQNGQRLRQSDNDLAADSPPPSYEEATRNDSRC